MKKPSPKQDPDLMHVAAALARASKRARKLAEQTGTEFVVIRDGKLVREVPKAADNKEPQSRPLE